MTLERFAALILLTLFLCACFGCDIHIVVDGKPHIVSLR